MRAIKKYIQIDTGSLIRRFLLSWLFAVMLEYLILPSELRNLSNLEGLAQMSLLRIIVITIGSTAILSLISRFKKTEKIERISLVSVFSLLAILSFRTSATLPFIGICLAVLAILIVYSIFGWNKKPKEHKDSEKSNKSHLIILTILSAAFFFIISAWTVGRIYCFDTPTYDFGLFAQMFHYMKETGLPLTTLERDGLLTHFAVHVSPIYYLLLLFYWIIPKPETLQILQAAVITSAVIPLWKIGKHHGLTSLQRLLMCAILLLYPAYAGGASYDLHENCFLTPLILWLFYAIDTKNTLLTFIATVLTLMIKEDAAVYVAIIALYLIIKTVLQYKKLDKKNLITGISMLIISLVWFFLVTNYLAQSGDGVMTNRYENFMYDGSGSLITVIKSIILNPLKTVYECVDYEKLYFIGVTMLPLLGIPLFTRRYERYLLLIPYILLNLMSDYQYQHSIFFQYSFGSIAFLAYLTIINLSDFRKNKKKNIILISGVVIGMISSALLLGPTILHYVKEPITNYKHYESIRDTLDTIPDDAIVAATTFYTTHLSQRKTIYDIQYCTKEHLLEAEYIVLKLAETTDYGKYKTDDKESGLDNLIQLLKENGYDEYNKLDNILVIYHKS